MKRLLYITFALLLCISYSEVSAKKARYSGKGCILEYQVIKKDIGYQLYVTVTSETVTFPSEIQLLIKTASNEVIKLEGHASGSSTDTAGAFVVGIPFVISEQKSTACFDVTADMFEQIKDGIIKIRLSMLPKPHEQIFKNNKFSDSLYEAFLQAKSIDDNF